jgi:DNA replication protein DnaC
MPPKQKIDPKTRGILVNAFYRTVRSRALEIVEPAFQKVANLFAEQAAPLIPQLRERNFSGPERGLILFGNTGSGKTRLVKVMSEVYRNFIPFVYYSARHLTESIRDQGLDSLKDIKRKLRRESVIIDDVGSESDIKLYGNDCGLLEILLDRYDSWEDYGAVTVITTNLNGFNKIMAVYGERCSSRIAGMCETVILQHEDRRISR